MSLSIRFLSRDEASLEVAVGEIVIDGFAENFEAPLHYWSRDEYECQWREGLLRIEAGSDKSCLVTSMHDPMHANFIVWWVVYREGQMLHVQNQMLFFDQLTERFDSVDPYRHIRNRITTNVDGMPISEWICRP